MKQDLRSIAATDVRTDAVAVSHDADLASSMSAKRSCDAAASARPQSASFMNGSFCLASANDRPSPSAKSHASAPELARRGATRISQPGQRVARGRRRRRARAAPCPAVGERAVDLGPRGAAAARTCAASRQAVLVRRPIDDVELAEAVERHRRRARRRSPSTPSAPTHRAAPRPRPASGRSPGPSGLAGGPRRSRCAPAVFGFLSALTQDVVAPALVGGRPGTPLRRCRALEPASPAA